MLTTNEVVLIRSALIYLFISYLILEILPKQFNQTVFLYCDCLLKYYNGHQLHHKHCEAVSDHEQQLKGCLQYLRAVLKKTEYTKSSLSVSSTQLCYSYQFHINFVFAPMSNKCGFCRAEFLNYNVHQHPLFNIQDVHQS